MPVRKRGKVWEISVTVGGRRVRKAAGRGATKEDAYRLEHEIRRSLIDQRSGIQPNVSLEKVLAEYIKQTEHLKSYDSNISHIERMEPYVRGRDITEASTVATNIKQNMKVAPATINRRLALLRRACNMAYKEWGWIDKPVGDKITLLPTSGNRMVFLTEKEVETLADHAGEAKDAILLLAYTGLRRSELFRAEKVGNNIYVRDSKTGKPRTIPIPHRIKHITLPIKLTDQMLRTRFEKARKATGMEHVRLHDLRHTYASWLIQRGTSLRAAQELLGHSTLAMTQRYAHLDTSHLRASVDAAFAKPRNNKAQNRKGKGKKRRK